MRRTQRLSYGIVYALLASFVFATLGALIKVTTRSLSPANVLFFRQLFGFIIFLPYLAWWGYREGRQSFVCKDLRGQIIRSVVSVATAYCVVFAIALIPLSDAITLSYTRPLFLPFVVWILLGKRVEAPVWLGLALGFLGVAFILKPQFAQLELGTIIGVASGILGSVAVLQIRRIAKVEPAPRILGYYFAFSIVLTGIPVLFLWETPTEDLWLALVGIGILSVLDQLFLTLAYRHGRATLISGVLYATVLFTLIWDVVIWGALPDWWSAVGMLLICLGAIIALAFSQGRPSPGEQPLPVEPPKKE